MANQFNHLTEKYLAETDLAHRKALGQYFTPKDLRLQLLSKLPRTKAPEVLDPACGSGEFLISAGDYFDECSLYGWEIDPNLARLSMKVVPDATIKQTDSLTQTCLRHFDFVIGNPPYFEFKPDQAQRERYQEVICGRANIFSMFVKLGLDALKSGGYLAYVMPPSMNNGAYFARLREFIIRNANIEYLSIQESSALFDKAQQTVMVMVLKKDRNKGDYVFTKNGITIFSPDKRQLTRAFRGKTTLKDLGATVRTGRIVWNQHREELTNNPAGAVPLVRAHNITDSGLVLKNTPDKPQYIKTNRTDVGPAIVVNRVTGAAKNVRLKAALIKPGFRFLGENHVNVIYPPPGMTTTEQKKLLRAVCAQINAPETMATMKLVTGNTQISRTELECLLPLNG